MGLGPTWILLSLCNIAAARMAGAYRYSFAVCGDDLVGYWPQSVIDKYIDIIGKFGMKVNQKKSFTGHHGVFCEQFVIAGSTMGWSEAPITLSEKYSSQYFYNLGGTLMQTITNAPSGAPILRKLKDNYRGFSISVGGKGKKTWTRKAFKDLLIRGNVNITYNIDKFDKLCKLREIVNKATEKDASSNISMRNIEVWLRRDHHYDNIINHKGEWTKRSIDGKQVTLSLSKYKKMIRKVPKNRKLTKKERHILYYNAGSIPKMVCQGKLCSVKDLRELPFTLPDVKTNLGVSLPLQDIITQKVKLGIMSSHAHRTKLNTSIKDEQ